MSDRSLSLLHDGKMAEIAHSFFNEIVEQQKSILFKNMQNLQRQGKHDVVEYVSQMAAFNALESLQLLIIKKISVGRNAEKERIENGHSADA